jgi:hypothetical protein
MPDLPIDIDSVKGFLSRAEGEPCTAVPRPRRSDGAGAGDRQLLRQVHRVPGPWLPCRGPQPARGGSPPRFRRAPARRAVSRPGTDRRRRGLGHAAQLPAHAARRRPRGHGHPRTRRIAQFAGSGAVPVAAVHRRRSQPRRGPGGLSRLGGHLERGGLLAIHDVYRSPRTAARRRSRYCAWPSPPACSRKLGEADSLRVLRRL